MEEISMEKDVPNSDLNDATSVGNRTRKEGAWVFPDDEEDVTA